MKLKEYLKILLFLFLIFIANASLCAQNLMLKVKKGQVELNGKAITVSSPSFTLKNADKLLVPKGTVVAAIYESKFFELPSGKIYNLTDILNLGKPLRKQSSLIEVVTKTSMQNVKNQYGSSTRGDEREPNFYSPFDDPILFVLDENLKLEIGNIKTNFLSKVTVTNYNTKEIIFEGWIENNEIVLSDLKEGEYVWNYKIKYEKDNKVFTSEYSNRFIMPTKDKKNKLLEDYCRVERKLDEMYNSKEISLDMRSILIEEYKSDNRIFYNKR
jgi:hypothetical protein